MLSRRVTLYAESEKLIYVYSYGDHAMNGSIKAEKVTLKEEGFKEGFNCGKISKIITEIFDQIKIKIDNLKEFDNREYGFPREHGKDILDEAKKPYIESRLKENIERHNIVFLFKMKNELYWAVYLCKTCPPQDRVKTQHKKWVERYISSLKSEQEKYSDKILSPAEDDASSCSVMLKSKKSSRKSKSQKSQRRIQKRIQKSKRRSKRSKRRTQKKT
jgi:nicotinamide mononucleotide adenylyltransferase